MTLRLFAHLVLVASTSGMAVDPVPPPKPAVVSPFPDLPAPVNPVVPPGPQVDPNAVPTLTAELLYVVKEDAQFLLYASPPGLVTITKEAGPLKLRGRFIDGKGAVETRTIAAKNIAIVETIPGKSGRVELIYVPVGEADEGKAIRRMVDVNTVPQPPPVPVPPKPKPDPVPTALMGKGGFVCIVEETADLATERRLTFTNAALNSYMVTQNHKWRIVDQNVHKPNSTDPPEDVVRFLAASKGKALPQVFLCNSKGEIVFQENLPSNGADLLALIKRSGG